VLKPHWFQILLSLGDTPRHGLAIRDEVLDRTRGEMQLWPATLYRSLQQLEEKGLIVEVPVPEEARGSAGQPRFYALTDRGRLQLNEEIERLERYVAAARAKRIGGA
jgi:DNA-binding PadR family transcriptional regulator